jgi:hypothetical protein
MSVDIVKLLADHQAKISVLNKVGPLLTTHSRSVELANVITPLYFASCFVREAC